MTYTEYVPTVPFLSTVYTRRVRSHEIESATVLVRRSTVHSDSSINSAHIQTSKYGGLAD